MKKKKPELLLPAGSMDCLKAAILNGADAVYFGAKAMNARIRAENFDDSQMMDAIDYCHFHKKKAYLAMNILVKDSELNTALNLAKTAYCMGIDGVIVQDLGLAAALHELLPNLKLIASTQMTCHNVEGAEFLADLGIKKIVLSRELTLEEIKEISAAMKKRNVEIECFAHGALCFSYSGQCLFSSFAFGKSGNRGLCLQPCRMLYSIASGAGEKKKGYFLSMVDLMTIDKINCPSTAGSEALKSEIASGGGSGTAFSQKAGENRQCCLEDSTKMSTGFGSCWGGGVPLRGSGIKELIDAGVDSFKIEGRLKGVGYCAITAKNYRAAIDAAFGEGKGPTPEDVKLMKIAFLRKHNAGYAFGEAEMVSPESSARQGIPAAQVTGFVGKNIELRLIEDVSVHDLLSVIKGEEVEEFSVKSMHKGAKEIKNGRAGEILVTEFYFRPYLEKGQFLYFTKSKELDNFAYSSIKRAEKEKYDLIFKATVGKKNSAVIRIGSREKEIFSDFTPEQESTSSDDLEKLLAQKLAKENDFLEPREFKCELVGRPFIPLSIMKEFKNKILAEGRELLFSDYRKQVEEVEFRGNKERLLEEIGTEAKKGAAQKQGFVVILDDEEARQLGKSTAVREKILSLAEIIVLPGTMNPEEIRKAGEILRDKKILVKSGNIQEGKKLSEFAGNFIGKEAIVCSNLGALNLAVKSGKEFWVGSEIGAMNSLTIRLLLGKGAEKIIPSVELSLEELNGLQNSESIVPMVFFYPLLMTSKAYAKSSILKEDKYTLLDRKDFHYKMIFDKERLLRIYNPVPVDMLFEIEKFKEYALLGIDLATLDEKESLQTLEYAKERLTGKKPKKNTPFTRGHYR